MEVFYNNILFRLIGFALVGWIIIMLMQKFKKSGRFKSNKSYYIGENSRHIPTTNVNYRNYNRDILLANKIEGLEEIKRQTLDKIQPVFYFALDTNSTKEVIKKFLLSIPQEFEFYFECLKVIPKIEEHYYISIWKHDNIFLFEQHSHGISKNKNELNLDKLINAIFNSRNFTNNQKIKVMAKNNNA